MGNSQRRAAALGVVVLVVLAAGAAWWLSTSADRSVVFVIPPGTAERQAAGEPVAIFPDTIQIDRARQDTLVIRNDDRTPVQIGPYKIAPGQSFTQRFSSRGTFELLCSVHGGQRLRIVVR